MPQGIFLSLDGVDGAGKSTQCRLLAEWLQGQGRAVTLCRDPGGTPVGDRIRSILLDSHARMTLRCEAFLYMASRAQLVEQIITPALARSEVVVADRYLLANVVYQGHAGGLPPKQLWEVGRVATSELLPDLTLVLDLPLEVAAARKGGTLDRIESRGQAFQAKVRAGFHAEARRNPETIKLIDANRPVEEVQAAIREEVARVLGPAARP